MNIIHHLKWLAVFISHRILKTCLVFIKGTDFWGYSQIKEIIGRGRKLRINYRTTEENRRWAVELLKGIDFHDLNGGHQFWKPE